jgi:hypothetical protein
MLILAVESGLTRGGGNRSGVSLPTSKHFSRSRTSRTLDNLIMKLEETIANVPQELKKKKYFFKFLLLVV